VTIRVIFVGGASGDAQPHPHNQRRENIGRRLHGVGHQPAPKFVLDPTVNNLNYGGIALICEEGLITTDEVRLVGVP